MKSTFEEEVRSIWNHSSGNLLGRLEVVRVGLRQWSQRLRNKHFLRKEELKRRLVTLLEAEMDEAVLDDIVDTRVHLNWEIDCEGAYWE